jgi:hypothetical protein
MMVKKTIQRLNLRHSKRLEMEIFVQKKTHFLDTFFACFYLKIVTHKMDIGRHKKVLCQEFSVR